MKEMIVCQPKRLPAAKWAEAARMAVKINPVNHPYLERLMAVMPDFKPEKDRIAAITTKYWHSGGVKLTVGFLDDPPSDLRARILGHMNAWAETASVKFTESKSEPQVRIARVPGDGYWSYLGTDILQIPPGEPTMNLEAFTMQTEESEYRRVVRHETGHTMGFPHEHMRAQLVQKIDRNKAFDFFNLTQGWSKAEVETQVLTPIEESRLIGTELADALSIMCYQIPGAITVDGHPIPGGTDIDPTDYAFAATLYPKGSPNSPPKIEKAL